MILWYSMQDVTMVGDKVHSWWDRAPPQNCPDHPLPPHMFSFLSTLPISIYTPFLFKTYVILILTNIIMLHVFNDPWWGYQKKIQTKQKWCRWLVTRWISKTGHQETRVIWGPMQNYLNKIVMYVRWRIEAHSISKI